MAKNISLLGADYPDVPAVDLPKTGGGTARFVDADDFTTYSTLTVQYDDEKLEGVSAYKCGKMVIGAYTIKSGVLSGGYNAISFSITGITWKVFPVVQIVTKSTSDDNKNIYTKITSSSGIQLRAESSNSSSVDCYFIGMAE